MTSSCVHFPKPETSKHITPSTALQDNLSKPKQTLYVVAGELHSDIVLPTKWITQHGANIPQDLHHFNYLALGWGDYVAYTKRWGAKDLLAAFLIPSQSIVQVVGFNKHPERIFTQREVAAIEVLEENGTLVANFLNDSFETNKDGTPKTMQPSKWGTGYFIASPHRYYYPRMCNQWVSSALNYAGVDTAKPHPFMTSKTVIKQMAKFEQEVEDLD